MSNLIDKVEKAADAHVPTWYFPAENKQLPLKDLTDLSNDYAKKLIALGVKKQECVGVVLDNCSDYVSILLAIWRINAIAVPMRPRGSKYTQTDKHLQYCDQVCDFRLIIYADAMSKEVFSSWMTGTHKTAINLSTFIALKSHAGIKVDSEIAVDDIAILQFSSGSTGLPKGVIVNHAMMMVQLENLTNNHTESRHGLKPEAIASWTPVHHDLGLFIGILVPIYCNSLNILAPPSYYMRNPGRWFALLAEHQVDFTFSTNSALATTFNAIKRLHRQNDINLSKLHIYLAAEKVSPITVRRCWEVFSVLGLPREQIHIGYGMAENTLCCSCTKTDLITISSFLITEEDKLLPVDQGTPGAVELVSIGKADRDHDITIRDAAGHLLPELKLGELYIKSPCISPGYFNNPALTLVTFPEGYFCSGDLGFYYHGELYFYARRDDMIILGGRNIIPNDVEESVETLDFVRPTTTCLLAKENPMTGAQELVLLIEANEHADPELLNQRTIYVQKQAMMELNILIQSVIFCTKGAVEKTSSGKKRRKIIRDRFLNQELEIIGGEYA